MPNLIATKNLPFRGRRLKPGDPFTTNAQMARVLIAIGKAKADLTPPPVYQTTSLGAEGTMSTEESGPPKVRSKRTYRRRDLTAEKE